MKIKTRDVGLLAIGFFLGVVLTVSLTTNTPTRPPSAPASTLVLAGPTLASASLPPEFFSTTNIQWQAPPVHIVLPPRFIDSFDSQSPLYPPVQRRLDLIDTRYQPDIKLDDLK
jgi:hypothetical protein